MSFSTFFPNDSLSLLFVAVLIAWFASWAVRFRKEVLRMQAANVSLEQLDHCIEPLRAQQLWRDRLRISGRETSAEPGLFFDNTVQATFTARNVAVPFSALQTHFQTIFVAGCNESQLDFSELTTTTVHELTSASDTLRTETLLMAAAGALGTLLSMARSGQVTYENHGPLVATLPPAIWGVLFALAGNIVFIRFQIKTQSPFLANLRRKTITLWIPKLYPTVAQRAAQWAVQTLQNAARVTDASEAIEQNTLRFVAAITDARQAGETFAEGMRQFSHGIEASDQALFRAQSKLGAEVDKFAESLHRWTSFEDEIRRFYGCVEAHQKQLTEERKALEQMLSGYKDFVSQATRVLEQSATDVGTAATLLPGVFKASATSMNQTTADFQRTVSFLLGDLASKIEVSQKDAVVELQGSLEAVLTPILMMENRLRSLSEPFDRAAHNLTEIATNLWRLNESFSREVIRRMPEK